MLLVAFLLLLVRPGAPSSVLVHSWPVGWPVLVEFPAAKLGTSLAQKVTKGTIQGLDMSGSNAGTLYGKGACVAILGYHQDPKGRVCVCVCVSRMMIRFVSVVVLIKQSNCIVTVES